MGCLSTSNVPDSIDLDSVGSDISDIHEKNTDFESTWIKHYKSWQHQNSKRWNESSEKERRMRLKACLHNVAQVDSFRQDISYQHNNNRASLKKQNNRTQNKSRRSTETDISAYKERVRKNKKKIDRDRVKQSISKDDGVLNESYGQEKSIDEKLSSNKLSSFIEDNIVGSRRGSRKYCDNGAFSLWPIAA